MPRSLAIALAALAVCGFLAAATLADGSTISVTATWVGWDDQVGPYWQATPNGYRDGHIHVSVTAPGETITYIQVTPLKDGVIDKHHAWNTTPLDGVYILGVSREGVRLNTTDVPICDPVGTGPASYDLYFDDDQSVVGGSVFRVYLLFASGAKSLTDVPIPDTPGGLPVEPVFPPPEPSVPKPASVGACVASNALPPTTTTATTTTATTPAHPAKKPTPVCKKGQKSTAKHPCRKPKRAKR